MSISTAQSGVSKKRGYRLGKRAEAQERTRQRIVAAAVELHGSLGPARTSVAQIAERAGVQRHTFYAHFPGERDLLLACSGLVMERDPLPDVESWAALPPGKERIRHGLEQLYAWYARNEQLAASVLRDAEYHELTREIVGMRIGVVLDRAAALLGEKLDDDCKALLGIAIDFACWRRLDRKHMPAAAAELMGKAIIGVGE